jgi:hypothetical protein
VHFSHLLRLFVHAARSREQGAQSCPTGPFWRGSHVDQCYCFIFGSRDCDVTDYRNLVRGGFIDVINLFDGIDFHAVFAGIEAGYPAQNYQRFIEPSGGVTDIWVLGISAPNA